MDKIAATASAKVLFNNVVLVKARENAATYTVEGTVERTEAERASAASIVESLMSPRECGNYGLDEAVDPMTYQALRAMVDATFSGAIKMTVLDEMVLATYRAAREGGKSAKAAHTAATRRAADLIGHAAGSWAAATRAQDAFEKVARITWTTERNGVPRRHSKEILALDAPRFIERLADKNAYSIDCVTEA